MEELASRAQLENDVVVLSGLGEVDELDDVWVVELSHNLHFLEDVRSLHAHYVSNQSQSGIGKETKPRPLMTRRTLGLVYYRTSTVFGAFLKSAWR